MNNPRRPSRLRRPVYFTLVIVTTVFALALLTSAYQADGLTPMELLLLIFYTLLMLWISASFWTAVLGFWIQLWGGDRHTITAHPAAPPQAPPPRTAIVMPIYNEDPRRVFAGLRAIYQSLLETGRAEGFDVFILSDTRDPDIWVEEEVLWYRLCQDMHAHGQIFYRNREQNTARKSGNIADFLKRWGGRYRYMIVLDADSLMGGGTLVRMVDLMEANPGVALLQSPPLPINRESLFARILQFASSLYGGIFATGLAFWQLGDGNYWGHNAIIRVEPFVLHCGLPKLSGREPFGGEILSHDFVEAALLRKAGWEICLAPDLAESYEEIPPTLIDYAKRDRRWCQGNLQHFRMLSAKGFGALGRLHMAMGIMSYLSSPLWFLFLVLTGIEAYVQAQTEPVYFFGDTLFPVWPESYAVEMTTVLVVTLAMLFLPKFMGLILLLCRHLKRLRGYGGFIRVGLSVVLETLFSALTAPVLMLYQSKFVLAILLRRSVGWPAQQRGDHRLGFKEALAAHGGHTLIGLIAGVMSYLYVPDFFWWFTPVVLGLILSIPLSIFSSSLEAGRRARKLGLFLIPEEAHPPRVVELLMDNLARVTLEPASGYWGAKQAVVDPAVNALHLALLPERPVSKRHRYYLRMLTYQLLEEGPNSLTAAEHRALLSDPETLSLLHTLAWSVEEIDNNTGKLRLVGT